MAQDQKERLEGKNGKNTHNGGQDNDTLKGEDGSDIFVFAGEFGNDRVLNFDPNDPDEKTDLGNSDFIF